MPKAMPITLELLFKSEAEKGALVYRIRYKVAKPHREE